MILYRELEVAVGLTPSSTTVRPRYSDLSD